MYRKINLQLFAGENQSEEVVNNETNSEENANVQEDNVSNENNENNEEQENAEVEQKEQKEDKVPLATLLKEKERRKNAEKELDKYKAVQTKNEFKQQWINKGYDEDYAETQSEIQYQLKELQEANTNLRIDNEIAELAKDSEFFADAHEYTSEIKDRIREKGLTAEEAYMMIRGKTRMREMQEDIEQKALLKRRDVPPKAIPQATNSTPNNPYPLDDQDKKALAVLQSMQPESMWTEEKYYKMIKT